MNEEDYDLYYHALNYRTAASQHAEAAWKELEACHGRLLAREKESTEYGWRNVCILEKAYQDELAKRDAMTALARELLAALKNSYHGHACDPGICDASDKCHCGRDAAIAKAEAMLK